MDWNIEATEVLMEDTIRNTLPKIQGTFSHVPHNLRCLTPALEQGCTMRNLKRYMGLVMVAHLEPQFINPLTSRKKTPNVKWEHVAKNEKLSHLQELWRLFFAVFLLQKNKDSILFGLRKKTNTHPSLPSIYLGKKTNGETTRLA